MRVSRSNNLTQCTALPVGAECIPNPAKCRVLVLSMGQQERGTQAKMAKMLDHGDAVIRQFSGFLGAQQQSVNSLILQAFLKTD